MSSFPFVFLSTVEIWLVSVVACYSSLHLPVALVGALSPGVNYSLVAC